jgi:hypothetical protein
VPPTIVSGSTPSGSGAGTSPGLSLASVMTNGSLSGLGQTGNNAGSGANSGSGSTSANPFVISIGLHTP